MIEVERYRSEKDSEWDQLVAGSANGGFLHTRKFYSHHADRFEDASLLMYRKGRLRGVIPAARADEDTVVSHPGSTFGGLVFAEDAYSDEVEELVAAAESAWREEGVRTLTWTLPPSYSHRVPNQAVEHALGRRECRILQDASACVALGGVVSDEADLLSSYRSATRRHVKKAIRKGLSTAWIDDFADFWRLLEVNLAARHDVTPVHTLSEINQLRAYFPERIRLLGIFHGTELVAGTVVFDYGPALHTQYIAMDYDKSDLRPGNLLYHAFLLEAMNAGCRFASFGVSSERFGGEVNRGLRHFKESHAARPMMIQRYTWGLA